MQLEDCQDQEGAQRQDKRYQKCGQLNTWTKNIKMLEQRLILVAWGLWMNLVDIWEMPPGWGVSGTVPLQHTQGQCVVWHSDTDIASSPLPDYLGPDTSLALDRDRSQRKKRRPRF